MYFPLSLTDVSLWIAVTAIVLLVTYESLLSQPGRLTFKINKARFRLIAVVLGLAFMVTVLMKIMMPTVF